MVGVAMGISRVWMVWIAEFPQSSVTRCFDNQSRRHAQEELGVCNCDLQGLACVSCFLWDCRSIAVSRAALCRRKQNRSSL